MTPEWVDYLGAFSTAGAAVLAGGALYFAVKAGRDLVHDRRDTFELQILHEIYDTINSAQPGSNPHLRDFLRGQFPAIREYYEGWPQLWMEASMGVTTRPGFASDTDYIAWRGDELMRLAGNARREILTAVQARTGSR